MSRFVLTAQLQLRPPTNTGQVIGDIRRQLSNINVAVQAKNVAKTNTEVRQLSNSIDKASRSTTKLNNTFALSVRRFAAFAVATRFVSLFTSSLTSALDEAIQFERELIKISQVTGKTVKELSDLTNKIDELTHDFGVAASSLLGVSRILSQAGLGATKTKIALEALAKTELAPTFENITQTAEGAIAILAQFGGEVNDLEKQLGAINAVAGKFAVESGDLISVVRRTGGVFRAAGGDLNQLISLFTSVRATTRESAESIATGLRTIFTRIQRPRTVEFLKQFGVQLQENNGQFVGAFKAVERLSTALAGLDKRDVRFIRIAEELGGFRQIGKVIPLLQEFRKAQEALNVAKKGENSLTEDAEKAQAALAVQLSKVQERYLKLVRDITRTDTFKLLADSAIVLANSLASVLESTKSLLPLLAGLGAIKLGQSFVGVGSAVSNFLNNRAARRGFNTGGFVPGGGPDRDSVLASLTPGEFVFSRRAVNNLGRDTLEQLHDGAKFNRGGLVKNILPHVRASKRLSREEKSKRFRTLGLDDSKFDVGLKSFPDSFDGMPLILDGQFGSKSNNIYFNRDLLPARQAFSIAHEFGHFTDFNRKTGSYLSNVKGSVNRDIINSAPSFLIDRTSNRVRGSLYDESREVFENELFADISAYSLNRKAKFVEGFNRRTPNLGHGHRDINKFLDEVYEELFSKYGIGFNKGGLVKIASRRPKTKASRGRSKTTEILLQNARELDSKARDGIFKQLGLDPKKFGVSVSVIPRNVDGLSSSQIPRGQFIRSENRLLVKANERGTLDTFAFGHELGHAIDFNRVTRKFGSTVQDSLNKTIIDSAPAEFKKHTQKRLASSGSGYREGSDIGQRELFADIIGFAVKRKAGVQSFGKNNEFLDKVGALYLNRGGYVPGSGPNKDTVPAMLSPGEFVLRRDAVNAIGIDNLIKMNKGQMFGYRFGGEVGKKSVSDSFNRGGSFAIPIDSLVKSTKELIDEISSTNKRLADDLRKVEVVDLSKLSAKEKNTRLNTGETIDQAIKDGGLRGLSFNGRDKIAINTKRTGKETLAHELGHQVDNKLGASFGFGKTKNASEVKGTFQNKIVRELRKSFENQGLIDDSNASYRGSDAEIFADVFAKATPELRKLLVSTHSIFDGSERLVKMFNESGGPLPGLGDLSADEFGGKQSKRKEGTKKTAKTKTPAEPKENAKLKQILSKQLKLEEENLKLIQKKVAEQKNCIEVLKNVCHAIKKAGDVLVGKINKVGSKASEVLASASSTPKISNIKKTEVPAPAPAPSPTPRKPNINIGDRNKRSFVPDPQVSPGKEFTNGGELISLLAISALPNLVDSLSNSVDASDHASSASKRVAEELVSLSSAVITAKLTLSAFGKDISFKDIFKSLTTFGEGGLGDKIKTALPKVFKPQKEEKKIKELVNQRNAVINSQKKYEDEHKKASKEVGRLASGISSASKEIARLEKAVQKDKQLRSQKSLFPGALPGKDNLIENQSKLRSEKARLSNLRTRHAFQLEKARSSKQRSDNNKSRLNDIGTELSGLGVELPRVFEGRQSRIKSASLGRKAGRFGRIGGAIRGIGSKVPGISGIAASIGPFTSAIVSAAGPIAAFAGGVFVANKLISAYNGYQEKLNDAIEEGDVKRSKELAVLNQTPGIIQLLNNGLASLGVSSTGLAETWINFMSIFGGSTLDSIRSSTEAQALSVKYSKDLANNLKKSSDTLEEVVSGKISIDDAIASGDVTANFENASKAFDAAIKASEDNNANRSTSLARNAVSALSFGLLAESTDQVNRRIDKENKERNSVAQDNLEKEIDNLAPVLRELARNMTLASGEAVSGADFIDELRDKIPGLASQLEKLGSVDIAKAAEEQSKAIIENIKFMKSLNFGLKEVSETARLTSSALSNLSNESINKFDKALSVLELSVSQGSTGIDVNTLQAAQKTLADTLQGFGASDQIVNNAINSVNASSLVQSSLEGILTDIKDEAVKQGEALQGDETKQAFIKGINEVLDTGNGGQGFGKEIRQRIFDSFGEFSFDQEALAQLTAGNIRPLIDGSLGPISKAISEEVLEPLRERAKQEQELINLTKSRIETENRLLSAQTQAINVQEEAAKLVSDFGGKFLNPGDSSFALRRANVNNSRTGLSDLVTGSAAELRRRNAEIFNFSSALNADALNRLGGDPVTSSTFGDGVDGVARATRFDDLKKAQQDQINVIKDLIKADQEALKITQARNKQEQDSLNSLINGDIEAFLRDQASAGATAALATGNRDLINSFGAEALAGAFADLQRQSSEGVRSVFGQRLNGQGGLLEAASQSALSARGITDIRSARALAGTTIEEEAINKRIRDRASVLGEAGDLGVDLARMDLQQDDVRIAQANVALNLNNQNLVNALNNALPQAAPGRNRNPAQVIPQANVAAQNVQPVGPQINVEALNGAMTTFNNNLSSNIDRLEGLRFNIKLEDMNFNVNLTGAGMLKEMTQSVGNLVIGELSDRLSRATIDNNGRIKLGPAR